MDRSYRRGAVMGLTIAEAFILIAFALLLLFAFWQWEVQKENTPEVQLFRTLTEEQRKAFVEGLEDGSMEAFVTLREQGIDFNTPASVENPREKWRFIDKDDERRILDAISELPEDAQRDLADLVEAGDAVPVLQQLSVLQSLIEAGQSVDVDQILEANEKLSQIAGKIQGAAEQEAELVGTLKRQLGEIVSSVGGYIDDNGAIILPDAVLFDQGKANITPGMGRFLAKACGPWLSTLRSSGVQISEVKIEGHASSEWRPNSSAREAYLGNLDLSQRRSQSVLRACLDFVPNPDVLEWARKHLIAVGYSSVRPVLRAGSEDRVASRRVVFSVSPDRDALIDEIEDEAKTQQLSREKHEDIGFDRSLFGTWADDDGNCMDTRHEVLVAMNVGNLMLSQDECFVSRGLWRDPYTGNEFANPREIHIDHLVPLRWAWDHGASQWEPSKRAAFFNDPMGLFVVEGSINQSKSDRWPLEWLPPLEEFQCQYSTRFNRMLMRYELELSDDEQQGFEELLSSLCAR
jgi:outer membrane protein OmpA-like peptidoglycan-associated protein